MISDNNVNSFRNENRIQVRTEREGTRLTIFIKGFMNALTISKIQETLTDDALQDVTELIFDLNETEYMSSFGLRTFLAAQKKMDEKGGRMVVRGVKSYIMELFEMTGFVKILNIED